MLACLGESSGWRQHIAAVVLRLGLGRWSHESDAFRINIAVG